MSEASRHACKHYAVSAGAAPCSSAAAATSSRAAANALQLCLCTGHMRRTH
eukprot:CAMPEP_0179898528 /NCGR_PEP_ID=MMETSP0982-20121206/37725_1 /TAXON_ID=483367 /ORGANISM="non described non described, Strain CCMP 2436" /LENGTH=50 /DNA_ID=CAMNT_0021795907 /DNA_START=61 /DNA_END=210 /DNA_ORIENTATION=+